jgi:hypothetical protein
MASGPFSLSVNPASVPQSKLAQIGSTAFYLNHQSFQYSGMNQGVFTEPGGLSEKKYLFSSAAAVFPYKNFFFSGGWYVSYIMDFPDFSYSEMYTSSSLDYVGTFPGREDVFFMAAAYQWNETFVTGIKLDYTLGGRKVKTDYTIRHMYEGEWHQRETKLDENHRSMYATITVGSKWKLKPNFSLASALIFPIRGKVTREVNRSFFSTLTEVDLLIPSTEHRDNLYRPKKILFGCAYEVSSGQKASKKTSLTLAAEAMYSLWSDYKYESFSEIIPRDLRNTLVLSAAAEFGIYTTKNDFFLRIGYRMDPQPVRNPLLTLQSVSGGVGIQWGNIGADVGCSYYFGSVSGYSPNHFIVSSSVRVRFSGE